MPGYWNLKSDLEVKNEITSQLSINSLDLIGRYRKHTNGFTFFDNIRLPNFSPLPKIKSNKDDKLANAKIIVHKEHSKDLKNGSYYHFTSKVIPQSLRIKHNNEFIFTVKNDSKIIEYKPNAKDLIDSIYERFDKADSANNNDISKALNTITYQINKKPETFIYELLQNADDNAGNRDVKVTFYITDKYLLVFHNGEPFTFNNVFAICSVNAEDKSDDIDKIGFKGIGFKSVFKDNDWVFINSGEYSFRFDQSNYSVEKPWQLMPIWTPIDDIELDKMIKNNHKFLSENVSIALRPTNNDIKLLSKYSDTLELFNDDRILLFLKKVKQVHVSLQNKEKIHCRKNNAIWDIRDYTIEVNPEIKTWLNEQIRNNNQEVPIKYQDIGKFKISYAYKVEGGKVKPLVDSTLFNYLPLSISLGFPFLVNSDFIPDGDREELYLNTWNEYLMTEIGRYLPKFISDIVFQKIGSFHLLPDSAQNNFQNSKWNQLYEWFLQGYVESLTGENPIAFIPTKSGSLETLSNVLIDETGLFELLGDEFSKLTGISEKLIDSKVGEGVEKIKNLIKQNDVGLIYDAKRLKDDIQTKLQDWLKNPSNNFKFIEHLYSNDSLKGLLKSEEIVLSSNGELSQALNLFTEVPKEIIFLQPKQVDNEVLNLINDKEVKLEFKKFDPIQYFLDSILDKVETLKKGFENETNIVLFWQFIFNNWPELEREDILDCLKNIEILCKSESANLLSKCVISKSYLSKEYNLSNEIESTVRSIIKDAHFISEKYILNSGDEIKWRKIFNRLDVIGDLQKTVDNLLPKLSSIKEENHFIITKQIFKYWKDNKERETRLNKDQLTLIKNNLKLKCTDNIFRVTSESIISDHYQTNKVIDKILAEVCLSNQISSDYTNTQISEWNTFFKEIGCISLEEKQQVLDAKLSFIILKQDDFQEIHFEYIKGIYDLYNLRNTNGLDFDFVNILSRIKLKTRDNEFRSPFDIHLSSIYDPKLDLEMDSDLSQKVHFLSQEYYDNRIPKKFLIKIGVNDNFKFLPVIDRIHIDKFKNEDYLQIFLSMKSYIERYNVISRNYTHQQIRNVTTIRNHISLNYDFVFTSSKYLPIFWDLMLNDNFLLKKIAFKTELRIWDNNIYPYDNCIIHQIKSNETVLSNGLYKSPSDLYSRKLMKYLGVNEYSDLDFSAVYIDEEKLKSLEELIGIRQELSSKHVICLMSNDSISLTEQEIKDLNIAEILKKSNLDPEELKKLKFPNSLFQWKPFNELFFSNDPRIIIKSEQHIHEYFLEIAKEIGIKELSEDNLQLKTVPEYPSIKDDIECFYQDKAKFIAFKIDQTKWMEIESNIIEHLSSFKFYEVELISKIFPPDTPIYEQILDFHYNENTNEVLYKGFWKSNKSVLEFLHSRIQSEKIENVWFDNIINRWNDKKIIETLIDMFGFVPDTWVSDKEEDETESQKDDDYIDPFWSALTDSDIEFIREIIGGEYELDEQMDSNLAAKIKTLMIIRSDYSQAEISDEGYFLRAGLDEIIVRSAQRGLLFLDLYHWKRLGEKNVKLAIHTNNQITFFRTQQDLFDFAKPMNKYGIMKLPISYSLADFNSIGKVSENGKWHFVIIVNENTKTAESYKEVMNLDQYNI